MGNVTRILKALANPRRLAIIKLLSVRGDLPVFDIAKRITLSFKATSKHLLILHAADIIARRQDGLTAFYRLSHPPHPIVRIVLNHL